MLNLPSFGFNRNIVECKALSGYGRHRFFNGFNRNIVECKAKADGSSVTALSSFNRNIVECKGRNTGARTGNESLVLIETLWNVKGWRVRTADGAWVVLIETLWNVKGGI